MQHIFIINPAAGNANNTMNIASAIKSAAKEEGITYQIFTTQYPKHATKIVSEFCRDNPDVLYQFYACGGDGTLNEVVAGAVLFKNARVAHVPCGTGNDFIRIFGDLSKMADLKGLINGEPIEIDYIKTDSGISLNIASIGLDARIAYGMQKYKRLFPMGGQVPYLISTVEQVLKPYSRQLELQIDDRTLSGRYTLVLIANGRYYGGGFNPVPDADPTDGLLDVLLIKAVSRVTIAKVIDAYKQGRYCDFPQFIDYYQCKKMMIRPQDGKLLDLNLDGEVSKVSMAEIFVGQGKISFVVPKNVTITL